MVGYSPQGRKVSDTTSDFTFTLSQKKKNKKREKGTDIIYRDNIVFQAWGRNYMYKFTKLS